MFFPSRNVPEVLSQFEDFFFSDGPSLNNYDIFEPLLGNFRFGFLQVWEEILLCFSSIFHQRPLSGREGKVVFCLALGKILLNFRGCERCVSLIEMKSLIVWLPANMDRLKH